MKLLTILALIVSSFVIRHSSFAAGPPNIVFILLDNVGQEWFGSYGSLENATPNMDKLAAGGARFTHCYATPYCSTSRVQLLTGRYPHTTGWRFHHDAGIYGGGNFDWRREITFARVLRDAGYATCVAGKWQINNFNEPGQADCLREHGFDEHLITPGGKEDSKYWDPLVIENGRRSIRTGGYGPDLFTDFIIDFIRRKKDAPFLAYFPITLVHTPLPATPRTKGKVLPPVENFAENLRYADMLIGRIIATLDELKLRDNTIVFVSADNGGPPSFPARTERGVVKGAMGSLAEQSVDMPMIVNCPALIKPARTAALTDYSDVLPTMAALAKAPLPQGLKVDGHSYAAWLLGEKPAFERDWIHTALNDQRILRDQRFKLYSNGGFFDVTADVKESNDLTLSSAPEIVAARTRLEAAMKTLPQDATLPFEAQSVASKRYREDKAAGRTTILKKP